MKKYIKITIRNKENQIKTVEEVFNELTNYKHDAYNITKQNKISIENRGVNLKIEKEHCNFIIVEGKNNTIEGIKSTLELPDMYDINVNNVDDNTTSTHVIRGDLIKNWWKNIYNQLKK